MLKNVFSNIHAFVARLTETLCVDVTHEAYVSGFVPLFTRSLKEKQETSYV
jgi:hypothetical protein